MEVRASSAVVAFCSESSEDGKGGAAPALRSVARALYPATRAGYTRRGEVSARLRRKARRTRCLRGSRRGCQASRTEDGRVRVIGGVERRRAR